MPTLHYAAHCRRCGRDSVCAFDQTELAEKLASRKPIELTCSFESITWMANAYERVELVKRLAVAQRVATAWAPAIKASREPAMDQDFL